VLCGLPVVFAGSFFSLLLERGIEPYFGMFQRGLNSVGHWQSAGLAGFAGGVLHQPLSLPLLPSLAPFPPLAGSAGRIPGQVIDGHGYGHWLVTGGPSAVREPQVSRLLGSVRSFYSKIAGHFVRTIEDNQHPALPRWRSGGLLHSLSPRDIAFSEGLNGFPHRPR
jgi:hypothetical protein